MPKVTTLDDYKQLAESRGGKCLSKTYINSRHKLEWQCSNGHTWFALTNNVKKGNWCRRCTLEKSRNTIEMMQELASNRGWKCLSTEYKSSNTPLKWQCEYGHVWEATYTHVKRDTYHCPACIGRKRTLKDLQEYAKSRGGKCLATEYTHHSIKLDWQCKHGHIWQSKPCILVTKSWCHKCAKMKKGTIEEMKAHAKSKKGKCLSTKYINCHTKLKWQCEKGHVWNATPSMVVSQGYWCAVCSGHKKTIEDMHAKARLNGGKCLSKELKTMKTPLKWECKLGHTWLAKPHYVYNRNSWCSVCRREERRQKRITEHDSEIKRLKRELVNEKKK